MRNAYQKFEDQNVALYALSYDDQEVIQEFSDKQNIPYTLLSDVDSKVIREYGILNDQVSPGDAMLYGIPYPGVYLCDENGVVTGKSFHDTYKKRDSPELLLDAAVGNIHLDESAPMVSSSTQDVTITAAVHGGDGSLRQGLIRHLVLRFELGEGLHLYGKPVPEGMLPLEIEISGPPGLVTNDAIYLPTKPLELAEAGVTLNVWKGQFDVQIPIYPVGELVSETRPLDQDSVDITIKLSYQACDANVCLLPKTQTMTLNVPLDVIDIPNIGMHKGHGQREGNYDGTAHLKRLMLRKIRQHPLGFIRYLFKHVRLQREANKRKTNSSD